MPKKDPFEIPTKYLPIEEKSLSAWEDKDGKPLKFLVAFSLPAGGTFLFAEGFLSISGTPKQSIFYITDNVLFLDDVRCIIREHPVPTHCKERSEAFRRVGLTLKGKTDCMISQNAMHDRLPPFAFEGIQAMFHTDGNYFQAYHVSSDSYFEGKVDTTRVGSLPFACGGRNIHQQYAEYLELSHGCLKALRGDCIVILAWDTSQKAAKHSKPKVWFFCEKDKKDKTGEICESVAIVNTEDQWACSLNVFHDLDRQNMLLRVRNSYEGTEDDWERLCKEEVVNSGGKLYLNVYYFVFFFPKEQSK